MTTQVAEFFGYAASLLVFAAFYMRRMLPLRLVAIASNLTFIVYASIENLLPILILHGALLPLNLLRLYELHRLHREVERATNAAFSIEPLLSLMQRTTIRASQVLFQLNDPADALYYVLQGTLYLPELNREVGPGAFLGEFALFSESGCRTTGAIARTDCVLMMLTRQAALGAITHHPPLAIYLLRLITIRMLQNAGLHTHAWPPLPAGAPIEPQAG